MIRDVIGYEGYYKVSDDGKIWSCRSNKFLKPKLSKAGYYRVSLSVNGECKICSIHRLVALAFIPNPMGKQTVNHKNEIKTDNRVKNLEWATNYEQNIHGTRIERVKAHTDYKSRNIDYKQVAAKHDYVALAKRNMKPIKQIALDGKTIKIYESLGDASLAIGRSKSRISSCATGKRKSCGGYRWEYVI